MRLVKLLSGVAIAALIGLSSSFASAQEQNFITIGTGGVTGVYYPAGGAICRLINRGRKEHGVRCSVESTGASVYNLRTVRAGELDFGVAQSDVQADALAAKGEFSKETPFENLRSVFSLHPEPLHVMVAGDADVKTVKDFKGKRVNIGNPGSGTRVLAEILFTENNIEKNDLALAAELKSSEQAAALCDGNIEISLWTAGLPNGSATEAMSTCDINLLDLSSSNMEKILKDYPAYTRAVIPGKMYPGNEEDIVSWGPRATIITDAAVPDEVVYTLVKAVFENFDTFKKLHPAFAQLTEEEMIKQGLPAPLHPGAVKYYKERGWM